MTSIICSLNETQLARYVANQLNSIFPDDSGEEVNMVLSRVMGATLHRVEACFSKVKTRYFKKEGTCYFNHLNGDQYSMFLYLLSNCIYKITANENVASKVFLLNKLMFGIDAFYKIELPEVFLFIHPIGTILGNAKYENFFVVYQGVTIGSKIDGIYPKFSDRTIVYSNSSIIGNSILGSNCIVGATAFLMDCTLENNKVILGSYPQNKVVNNVGQTIDYYFHFE